MGVTEFLAIGSSFYRGHFSSDSIRQNLNMITGSLLLRINKFISTLAEYGKTFLIDNSKRDIIRASLTAADSNKYLFNVSYSSMDAAQILYSPFLVDQRLKAEVLEVNGTYFAPSKLIFSGEYSFLTISDTNSANSLQLRLGKAFDKDFSAGYEYSYSDYDTVSGFYFSPQNYESHSIWGDWRLLNEKNSRLTIGGKLGVIPSDNFILREIYGEAGYLPFENLILQGRVSAGSSVRDELNYSSVSFEFRFFWTF
jgi:hypothetical protein